MSVFLQNTRSVCYSITQCLLLECFLTPTSKCYMCRGAMWTSVHDFVAKHHDTRPAECQYLGISCSVPNAHLHTCSCCAAHGYSSLHLQCAGQVNEILVVHQCTISCIDLSIYTTHAHNARIALPTQYTKRTEYRTSTHMHTHIDTGRTAGHESI